MGHIRQGRRLAAFGIELVKSVRLRAVPGGVLKGAYVGVEDFQFAKERVFDQSADNGLSDKPISSANIQWRAT